MATIVFLALAFLLLLVPAVAGGGSITVQLTNVDDDCEEKDQVSIKGETVASGCCQNFFSLVNEVSPARGV